MDEVFGSLTLLLLDSRSPSGGHSHSGGLEAAVTAGYVRGVADLESFCRGRLLTSGRVSAGGAAAAARLGAVRADPQQWQRLDTELTARMPSPAVRAASRQLGAGLRRLARAVLPESHLDDFWTLIAPAAPHHPIVLGAVCAASVLPSTTPSTALDAAPSDAPRLAARAAALATCTAPASAGVRLLGLDPYAVHAMLARLTPEIDAVADESVAARDLPAHSAPALDLLADIHATAEVRLFAS